MSTSRRRFIKAGLITAALGALPLNMATVVSAQKKRERVEPVRPETPLNYFNKAAFAAYSQTHFLMRNGSLAPVEMKLVVVQDLPTREILSAPDECFELLFEAPAGTTWTQQTYVVDHVALGRFDLFLVPVSRPQASGPVQFQAVFNRRTA